MISPKHIFILKIVSGNYGKLSARLFRHYPNSKISIVDLESLEDIYNYNDILIVIPGVGAFEKTISKIHSSKMHNSLVNVIHNPLIPKLAICLGFQALFSSSEETSSPSPALGLNIYSGNLLKFSPAKADYIVNTGFNNTSDCLSNDPSGTYYFNHSYYLPRSCIAANMDCFTSAFISNNGPTSFLASFHDSTRNLVGTQYHPEMSRDSAFHDIFSKLC